MNQPIEEGNEGVVEVDDKDAGSELKVRIGGEGHGNRGQDIPQPPKCNLFYYLKGMIL